MSNKFYKYIDAVSRGNYSDAILYYEEQFLNQCDKDGWSSIHWAAYLGQVDILKMLVEQNCDINPLTKGNRTPLELARRQHNDECARIIEKCLEDRKKIKGGAEKEECLPDKNDLHVLSFDEERLLKRIPDVNSSLYLGRGTFGSVYKYPDMVTGEIFALKKITYTSKKLMNQNMNGLENEIVSYSKLPRHPRIVHNYGSIMDSSSIYIFMDYVEEGSIKAYLVKNGPLEFSIIAKYSKHILEGLDFLHKHNIIHRNMKGENVLRDKQNNVRLSDFGISKFMDNISNSSENPYYMAPEVIQGEDYSEASDIWSFGATIVQMLTGKHPFPNLKPMKALFKIGLSKKIEYEVPQAITNSLKSFIDRVLEPDALNRGTVKELLNSDFIVDNE